MSFLIKDVLEYSRLSRSGISANPVDLNEVIKEVLVEFDLRIAERNAVISLDMLPAVPGAAAQFRQLFRNLIGNSLKFSTQQPRISIKASKVRQEELPASLQTKKNAGFVRIDLQDNGIGFDQQHADRKPRRGHYSRRRAGKGSCFSHIPARLIPAEGY